MPKRRSGSTAPRNPFDPLDGRVDETLDIHGFSAVEARAHVDPFLRAARKRCPGGLLHLITGRGRNSAGGSVLKPIVRAALASAPPTVVVAWGKDHADGGFLVRLAG
jgi:DNA-nicking Smr family endonuclease